jgi:hypothetical protein
VLEKDFSGSFCAFRRTRLSFWIRLKCPCGNALPHPRRPIDLSINCKRQKLTSKYCKLPHY